MPQLLPGQALTQDTPVLLVENRLKVGRYRFELVAHSSTGKKSRPVTLDIEVVARRRQPPGPNPVDRIPVAPVPIGRGPVGPLPMDPVLPDPAPLDRRPLNPRGGGTPVPPVRPRRPVP